MKSKSVLLPIILIVFIAFTGCPYESNVPLSDAKYSTIDPDITGKWIISSSEIKGYNDTLMIIRFNGHEFYLESHELKKSGPVINRGRAFITLIGDQKILNLCDLKEPGKFYFARYTCTGNRMITSHASDQYIKKEFTSSRELSDYFKTHITSQGFFEPADTLIRISEK